MILSFGLSFSKCLDLFAQYVLVIFKNNVNMQPRRILEVQQICVLLGLNLVLAHLRTKQYDKPMEFIGNTLK